jgi:2-phosphoglycerate kinase
VILIGGTSHAGKSSVAKALAERLGWEMESTDYLARHPGRPWPVGERAVPPHVVEYYRDLDDDERMASVLAHYRRLAPVIGERVRGRLEPGGAPLVLEGSALLPETVAGLIGPGVRTVWITAEPAEIERRLRAESRYTAADAEGRALIDAFLRRSLAFDRLMLPPARRLGFAVLNVEAGVSVEAVVQSVLDLPG